MEQAFNPHTASGRGDDLQRGLRPRHVIMMALGGAIGAGLFRGSDSSIGTAGPGVIFTYLIGGIILLFVMQGLAQMAIRQPGARTFRDLVSPALGPFLGHVIGWLYWLDWVLVMAAETATAAGFLSFWLPQVPLWLLALIVSVVMTLINIFQVRIYGETEYWLAGVKIVVLALFVICGAVLLFTGFGGHPGPGFRHLTDQGGLFPNGWNGFLASFLVVMFSFGGTEMIGVTLGETQQPERTILRAARGVIVRILLFYVLPILMIVSLVPWNQFGHGESPFVTVFQAIGVPYVPHIMNFVMLTAVLSATNSGMYAASRMLYNQALRGQAPRWFAHLSQRGVPVRALLVSTVFLYVGVVIAFFAKGQTFNYLMTIPGYSVVLVWIILAAAYLKSVPGHPGLRVGAWVAIIVLALIFIGVVWTTPLWGTVCVAVVLVLIILGWFAAKPSQS
ncbi:MAG: amino acid permease [Thermoflavifilum sp.]|nr:amino acid permease [Thermoflavifilum sp.]MCL6514045.1 amino acid permease [Alicyclobacillus sp.]